MSRQAQLESYVSKSVGVNGEEEENVGLLQTAIEEQQKVKSFSILLLRSLVFYLLLVSLLTPSQNYVVCCAF